MPIQVSFQQHALQLQSGETVLSALERHGLARPSSCRAGTCQTCLMKVTQGEVPPASQAGLKPAWRQQGYFLPCVCTPTADLVIDEVGAELSFAGRVTRVRPLAPDIVQVLVEVAGGFAYRPGQFVSLVRPSDGLMRPYSIASAPDPNASADGATEIELHVAVLPQGKMSTWLAGASVGQAVEVRGPSGECFYQAETPDQPIVLAGTGTGLAPLLGVVREALASGHRGPLHLYVGSRSASRLYLFDELLQMASEHPQLRVTGSVLDMDHERAQVVAEPLDACLFADLPKLDGHRVYLCGQPELVAALKKRAFLAGASLQQIHSDPFVTASPPT